MAFPEEKTLEDRRRGRKNSSNTRDRRRPEENPGTKGKRQTRNEEGEDIVRPELTGRHHRLRLSPFVF